MPFHALKLLVRSDLTILYVRTVMEEMLVGGGGGKRCPVPRLLQPPENEHKTFIDRFYSSLMIVS